MLKLIYIIKTKVKKILSFLTQPSDDRKQTAESNDLFSF